MMDEMHEFTASLEGFQRMGIEVLGLQITRRLWQAYEYGFDVVSIYRGSSQAPKLFVYANAN